MSLQIGGEKNGAPKRPSSSQTGGPVAFFFFLIFIFIYLAAPDFSCGMWDLSSLTRDGTRAPSMGSTECHPLYHQGRPALWALNTPVSPTPQHLASLQQ